MCRVNWDKHKSKFDRFRDTSAVIVEKGEYNSLWNTYNTTELGSITGDLQNYSGTLAEKDYGLAVKCQKKFYCNHDDNIVVGRYLVMGAKTYRIEYIADGKLGDVLLLKEANLNDKRKRDD